MSHIVESGVLRGRPFDGVAILIKNNLSVSTIAVPSGDISGITSKSLQSYAQTIIASDRFAVVKIRDCLIIDVCLPLRSTS